MTLTEFLRTNGFDTDNRDVQAVLIMDGIHKLLNPKFVCRLIENGDYYDFVDNIGKMFTTFAVDHADIKKDDLLTCANKFQNVMKAYLAQKP